MLLGVVGPPTAIGENAAQIGSEGGAVNDDSLNKVHGPRAAIPEGAGGQTSLLLHPFSKVYIIA